MIPDRHKSVSTISWCYHGDTGILLVMILEGFTMPNGTNGCHVSKVLLRYGLVFVSLHNLVEKSTFKAF